MDAKQFLLFTYFTGQASGTLLALSTDGLHWQQLNGGYESRLSQLGTSVIDADILRMPDGMWGMYYKDHTGYSHINVTESKDLYTWSAPKEALKINGEGPIAFQWKGYYWLIHY